MPYVIEPAAGLTPVADGVLDRAYATDEAPEHQGGVDTRTVLRLDPRLAPVKVAVLPLSRNERFRRRRATSRPSCARLERDFDDAQAIGRRTAARTEIGTPVTASPVDFDTLDDGAGTIRERDAMTRSG